MVNPLANARGRATIRIMHIDSHIARVDAGDARMHQRFREGTETV